MFTECPERHSETESESDASSCTVDEDTTYRRPATREKHSQTCGSPSKYSQLYVELFPLSTENRLKQAIRPVRKSFIEKALSSNKSREIWRVIHRILKPSPKPLRIDPDELNVHFFTTAQRTIGAPATSLDTLANIIDSLPEIPDNIPHFTIQPVIRRGVLECIKSLCSDSSAGADTILTRFVKLVAVYRIAYAHHKQLHKAIIFSYKMENGESLLFLRWSTQPRCMNCGLSRCFRFYSKYLRKLLEYK